MGDGNLPWSAPPPPQLGPWCQGPGFLVGWKRGWCRWGHPPPLPCTGIQRFCRDIHMMLGFKPGLYFRACWLFLSPATLLVTGVGGRAAGCWLGVQG